MKAVLVRHSSNPSVKIWQLAHGVMQKYLLKIKKKASKVRNARICCTCCSQCIKNEHTGLNLNRRNVWKNTHKEKKPIQQHLLKQIHITELFYVFMPLCPNLQYSHGHTWDINEEEKKKWSHFFKNIKYFTQSNLFTGFCPLYRKIK